MQIYQYGRAEINHLKRRDKKLGRAIDHIGMIERQVMPVLFKALVHGVAAQQISRKIENQFFSLIVALIKDPLAVLQEWQKIGCFRQ